jgi:hypothetical protein
MAKKFSENNAEDEIREAFRVFDSVSTFWQAIQKPGLGCIKKNLRNFQKNYLVTYFLASLL